MAELKAILSTISAQREPPHGSLPRTEGLAHRPDQCIEVRIRTRPTVAESVLRKYVQS